MDFSVVIAFDVNIWAQRNAYVKFYKYRVLCIFIIVYASYYTYHKRSIHTQLEPNTRMVHMIDTDTTCNLPIGVPGDSVVNAEKYCLICEPDPKIINSWGNFEKHTHPYHSDLMHIQARCWQVWGHVCKGLQYTYILFLWLYQPVFLPLRWRHNGYDSVSNHQPHDCLLNRLFRRKSKKTSKLRVTGLCAGNSPGTGEFPAQRTSNAENVSIWWRHHDCGDNNLHVHGCQRH